MMFRVDQPQRKVQGNLRPAGAPGVAERAERELRSNSYLALKNISCCYHDGVLTLQGCLPSYYLKQVAQAAVASLDGVERVDNQIEVLTGSRQAASL